MGSKIEITQELKVIRSETMKMNTTKTYTENVDHFDDDLTFTVQPGEIVLSIPSSALQTLNEDVLHLRFTGIVNATPLDPQNVQPLFVNCFAESSINWYWKSGLTQPDNRVDATATVLFSQYKSCIDSGDDFIIYMNMDVDISAVPLKRIDRIDYGSQY